jgi:uncharacterized membrane protein
MVDVRDPVVIGVGIGLLIFLVIITLVLRKKNPN